MLLAWYFNEADADIQSVLEATKKINPSTMNNKNVCVIKDTFGKKSRKKNVYFF